MGSVHELHSDSDVGPLLTRVTKGRVASSSIAAAMLQKSNDAMSSTKEQVADSTADDKARHQALREEVGSALRNPNDEKVFIVVNPSRATVIVSIHVHSNVSSTHAPSTVF